MLNVITDTCLGAALTRDVLKQPYANPFCWSIIDYNSMTALIKEYNTLNYENFKLTDSAEKNRFNLIIDDKVKILYEHYVYDANIEGIKKEKHNVYSKNIKEYIISKYKKRLLLNDKPLFIIGHTYYSDRPRKEKYEQIVKNNVNNYPMIIVLNNKNEYDYFKKYASNNIKIHLTNIKNNNTKLAFELYEKFKDFINLFNI